MSAVEIIEVGPRDGLQNQDAVLSIEDRIAFTERLIAAGARRLEIASFVNPARVPQMAHAEEVIAGVPRRDGVTRIGLVLNGKGLDRALETSIDEVGVVVIASDTFGIRNQKQTSAESVAMANDVIRRARSAGVRAQVTISVAFGCPFEGEIPLARVVDMARALAESQPLEIAIADTIGVGVPAQVKAMVAALHDAVPGIPLRAHFHNTRGTGIANAIAAYESGVTRLDASTGGIGGCPFAPKATGNIATEDLIYALERSGVATGYDLDAINALAPFLSDKLGLAQLPAMVSRAGRFPQVSASA